MRATVRATLRATVVNCTSSHHPPAALFTCAMAAASGHQWGGCGARGAGARADLAKAVAQVVAQHVVYPLQLHIVQVLLQRLRLIQLVDQIHLRGRKSVSGKWGKQATSCARACSLMRSFTSLTRSSWCGNSSGAQRSFTKARFNASTSPSEEDSANTRFRVQSVAGRYVFSRAASPPPRSS